MSGVAYTLEDTSVIQRSSTFCGQTFLSSWYLQRAGSVRNASCATVARSAGISCSWRGLIGGWGSAQVTHSHCLSSSSAFRCRNLLSSVLMWSSAAMGSLSWHRTSCTSSSSRQCHAMQWLARLRLAISPAAAIAVPGAGSAHDRRREHRELACLINNGGNAAAAGSRRGVISVAAG
jgi:hypothetical protein